MLFQATFVESKSKKGVPGRWRKQSAAQLNGLYMCDFDHVENPRQVYADWGSRARMEQLGVLLAYVTPSGLGLKLVAMADAERGNLIDNARWLASQLGMETDEACKDASRLSFISTTDDILYINDKIFTYDNKEFERKYGDAYRTGDSSGNLFGADSAGSGNGNGWGRGVGNGVDGKTGDGPTTKVGSVAGQEVGDDWDVNNCKTWNEMKKETSALKRCHTVRLSKNMSSKKWRPWYWNASRMAAVNGSEFSLHLRFR